jgi:serine/threonine-protein kinase
MDQNPTFAPTILAATVPLLRLGRYQILAELGQGAMGVVYEARDPTLERHVALKTVRLPSNMQNSNEFRARFHAEAKSAGQLSHPNIVTIYDFGEADDTAFIAMELLRGETLRELLDRQRFSVRRAVRYAIQIADGLSAAHALGVIHRDIKPSNVVRLESGILKITDFGIAQLPASNLTQAGTLLGTPRYMSPELIRGVRVDPRSDIFSLGVVLYEMLTSQVPFDGDSLSVIMYKVVNEAPIDPRDLNEHVSAGLAAVLARCLAKHPAERFESALELSRHLRSLSEEDAVDLALLSTFAPRSTNADSPVRRSLSGFLKRADRTLPIGARVAPSKGPSVAPPHIEAAIAAHANKTAGVQKGRRGLVALAPLAVAVLAMVAIFAVVRSRSGAASAAAEPTPVVAPAALSSASAGAGSETSASAAAVDAAKIAEPAPESANLHPAASDGTAAGMTPALGMVDEKIVIGGSTAKRAARKKAAETAVAAAPLESAAPAAAPAPIIEVAAPPAAAPVSKPSFQDQLKSQHDCLVSNRCDN